MRNTSIYKQNETVPFFDTLIASGKAWRFSTGRLLVAVSGEYASLHFHTPDENSFIYYSFARISKTGAEVEVTLIEGGEYSGGTEVPIWNMNRRPEFKNADSGLTDVSCGVSTTTTISGGVAAPSYIIPGASQGVVKAGGTSEAGFLCLASDEDYTVKATALDVNTYIDIMVNVGIY